MAGFIESRAAELDAVAMEKVGAATQAFVDDGSLAGALVVVARNGHVGYCRTFGRMGVDRADPMREDAVFRIYSMTKPVTTVAALMLWEEEQFALDDPVAEWLPALRHLRLADGSLTGRDITVRDLMCHTAGFANSFGSDPVAVEYRRERIGDGSLDDLVEVLGRMPLLHQPGVKFHYSLATDVLGRLVEIWSGKTLEEFLIERVFSPLRMIDTGFSVSPETIAAGRLTTNHMRKPDGSLAIADAPATSSYRSRPERFAGASGLVSTAADYLSFAQMLVRGGVCAGGARLLQEATVKLMTTNQLSDAAMPVGVLKPLPGLGFGLGLSVRVSRDDSTDPGAVEEECGWGGAAGTHFWMVPAQQLIVLTMRQRLPYDTRLENAIKPLVYSAL